MVHKLFYSDSEGLEDIRLIIFLNNEGGITISIETDSQPETPCPMNYMTILEFRDELNDKITELEEEFQKMHRDE